MSVRVGAVVVVKSPHPSATLTLPWQPHCPLSSPDCNRETLPPPAPLTLCLVHSERGLEGAGSPHVCTGTSPSLAWGQSHWRS